jgi:phosphate transport system protein
MMIDTKINELTKKVIEQSAIVENMLQLAIQGLLERDGKLLQRVEELEDTLNQQEMELEEDCIGVIALYHPEATNLRTVLMIMSMNSDLERMGDIAVNISESAAYIIQRPSIKRLINIPKMAEEVKKMLHNSITGFIEGDTTLAWDVCKNDDVVDDLQEQIYRVLVTYMLEDPTNIKRCMKLNTIASNLERMADLSTNIAEETIFMVEGVVIKHNSSED